MRSEARFVLLLVQNARSTHLSEKSGFLRNCRVLFFGDSAFCCLIRNPCPYASVLPLRLFHVGLQICQELLGDMLQLLPPNADDMKELPSPEQVQSRYLSSRTFAFLILRT